MTRVKRGFKGRRRRNKILDLAKGFRGSRKNRYANAIHVIRKSLVYAYRDRKVRSRDFRQLWIIRINAATRQCGMKYSEFMYGLKKSGIELDRSVLADLAVTDQASFANLVAQAKAALAS